MTKDAYEELRLAKIQGTPGQLQGVGGLVRSLGNVTNVPTEIDGAKLMLNYQIVDQGIVQEKILLGEDLQDQATISLGCGQPRVTPNDDNW